MGLSKVWLVLSPILFNIYLDILLNRLQNDGYDCHIGKQYPGSFAYADDIVLLSPTVSSLDKQLAICDQFPQKINMNFNATKSKLTVYGKSNVHDKFQGQTIPTCSVEYDVGNLVGRI